MEVRPLPCDPSRERGGTAYAHVVYTTRVPTPPKVHGPYLDNRQQRRIVILVWEDGTKKTTSYARWLMQNHLGRELLRTEHVDHIDGDPLHDEISNYQLLTSAENNRKSNLGRPSPLKGIERGWTHGTIYGWLKKGCECTVCDLAKKEWNQRRSDQRRSVSGAQRGPYLPRSTESAHGTLRRYKYGCRCTECRGANASAVRRRRQV